ncbi:MAG TPA: MarR family winged helix-turn-helix transcriptional regulator [Candidatus Methylomirabilis sp.]|jgi:DNA-binding MarR family transcriptional regulator|nr:MarR family winged helix-turn-helix transcriptional regulator [Candidatus Methylomirabilis sp.]
MDEVTAAAERMHRITKELSRRYQFRDRNAICCHGLSVTQCYALDALTDGGELTVTALARHLFLAVSTVTRILEPLERKGLARRRRGTGDRREVRIAITPRGRSLLGRIRAELVETQRALLSPLARVEREAVLKTLEGLVEAVTRWQDGCGPEGCGPVSGGPGATRRAGGSG